MAYKSAYHEGSPRMLQKLNLDNEFPDIDSLKEIVHDLSKEEGWKMHVRGQNSYYVILECKTKPDCPWEIRSSMRTTKGGRDKQVAMVNLFANQHNHGFQRRTKADSLKQGDGAPSSGAERMVRCKRKLTEMEHDNSEVKRKQKSTSSTRRASFPTTSIHHLTPGNGKSPLSSRRSKSLLQNRAQSNSSRHGSTPAVQPSRTVIKATDLDHRPPDVEEIYGYRDGEGDSEAQLQSENKNLSPQLLSRDQYWYPIREQACVDKFVQTSRPDHEGNSIQGRSTPNYLHHCPGHPTKCSHTNQMPALKTRHAIIYDLPMYTRRREQNHRRYTTDQKLFYGPELGAPKSSFEMNVRFLRPDETSIKINAAKKGAKLTSWLRKSIPVICPEWDVRPEGMKTFKLSGPTLVWEMNQKWSVDVPYHQAMSALRELRMGLSNDADLLEDGESRGSVEYQRSTPDKSTGSEQDEEAARLIASFTGRSSRKGRHRGRVLDSKPLSLWHVESGRWDDDDDDDDDSNDRMEHSSDRGVARDEDGILDLTSNTDNEQAASDDEDAMYADMDDDTDEAGYNTTLVDVPNSALRPLKDSNTITAQHDTHTEHDGTEAHFICLLRTYLQLGLTNTMPHRGRSTEINPRAPQQVQINLLEQGVKKLRGGDGVDENLLRFVLERCAAY